MISSVENCADLFINDARWNRCMSSTIGQPWVGRLGVWWIWNEITFSLHSKQTWMSECCLSFFSPHMERSPCTTWPFRASAIMLLQAKINFHKHNIKWRKSRILACEWSRVEIDASVRVTELLLIITSEKLTECLAALFDVSHRTAQHKQSNSPSWGKIVKHYMELLEDQNSIRRFAHPVFQTMFSVLWLSHSVSRCVEVIWKCWILNRNILSFCPVLFPQQGIMNCQKQKQLIYSFKDEWYISGVIIFDWVSKQSKSWWCFILNYALTNNIRSHSFWDWTECHCNPSKIPTISYFTLRQTTCQ